MLPLLHFPSSGLSGHGGCADRDRCAHQTSAYRGRTSAVLFMAAEETLQGAESSKAQILKVPPLILGSSVFFFFSFFQWLDMFFSTLSRWQEGEQCAAQAADRDNLLFPPHAPRICDEVIRPEKKHALCTTCHRGRVRPLQTSKYYRKTGNQILELKDGRYWGEKGWRYMFRKKNCRERRPTVNMDIKVSLQRINRIMSLQCVDIQSLLLSGDSVGIFRKRPTNDVQEPRDILG